MARQVEGPWYRQSKGTWYATVGGRKLSLKVQGEANRETAVRAWHRLMAGATEPDATEPRGAVPAPAPVPSAPVRATVAPVTTAVLIDEFLADVAVRVKANSLAAYTGLLTPVRAHFEDTSAESVTPTAIIRFTQRPEWGTSHRHNLIGAVATAFKWAESVGRIAHNPLKAVKRPPKASRGTKAVVSDDAHGKLLAAAGPELRTLLVLLYETGARPSELARLTAADVNMSAGVAILTEHKTAGATGKPRLLVLSSTAKALLGELVGRHPVGELLRNARGGKWTKDGIGLAVRRACRKAGVTATAYGYRHTYATSALAKGVPDATVAALLGHSSTAMLHRHYSHLTSQANVLRNAAELVRPTDNREERAAG
jgi:integrase